MIICVTFFIFIFAKKMSNISIDERKEHLENMKVNGESPTKLCNLKEKHLSRVVLMECVDREKHVQTENGINSKLMRYQRGLVKGLVIIEALPKEKEALMIHNEMKANNADNFFGNASLISENTLNKSKDASL